MQLSQVVQYILDLNDNRFSDAVIRQFTGNVCALSVQKFSSNVIEKVCFFGLMGCTRILFFSTPESSFPVPLHFSDAIHSVSFLGYYLSASVLPNITREKC